MNRRFNKSLIIGLLVILIISTMANSLIIFYGDFGIAQADRAGSGPRPGPKELLKNNGFSMISDWAFQNASTDLGEHVWAKYDDDLAPSVGKFESAQDLDTKTGIILYSYINQTFQKDITTPNYPTAVVCEFDWKMNAYHSEVDGSSRIKGEIFLQIVNNTPSSTPAQWGIATGAQAFQAQTDSRIPWWQNAKINVGSSISPKGSYNLSIILRLTVPVGSQVDLFVCDLVIDNVSLRITDVVKPLVVANSDTFGPYNVAPGNAIDVDFFDGGLENVSLKVGRYRLNGSSTWNTIFTNNKTYTQNWSIGAIFGGMLEGENTIDVYCADQVENFNDSVHITIIKDSVAPDTNASELEEYYRVPEFNINYTGSDAAPSGGYNNTVELWFEFNDGGSYQQYKPPEQPDGFFNQSPIVFDITKTGVGGTGEGSYNFYTIGVDNATNHETAPAAQNPDADTIVDYSLPISRVNTLASPISTLEFDVAYTATDLGSGIDYVELWYLLNGIWYKFNNSGTDKFSESPITFTAQMDGVYGLHTVAYDKSGNTERNGTPKITPLTVPDVVVRVDTQAPSPVFKLPVKDHIRGKETIMVTSDFDTEHIEFYFWLDKSENGLADNDDIGSTWVYINEKTSVDEGSTNNWSIEWNTGDFDKYLYFKTDEYLVILNATGYDEGLKHGEGLKSFIEVDNVAPEVEITNPVQNTAENGNSMTISYSLDNNDGNTTQFWYSEHDQGAWILINDDAYIHPANEFDGSYQWEMPQKLIDDQETIDIRVEVTDDTGNVGEQEVGPIYINRQGPKILDGFPEIINLNEDFGQKVETLTIYETHSNPDYTATTESLNWYVTGNSKKTFYITGGNNSEDKFTYRSILNKHGSETLTFHLFDPLGLEATIDQVVTVASINDPPVANFPTDNFHVTYGEADTVDLSIYISDVDNALSELSMVPKNAEHVTSSGLNLTFNYPADYNDQTELVTLDVSDGIDETSGSLFVRVTGNHRPKWVKDFPKDVVLKEGEPLTNILTLGEHFVDQDASDLLSFSAKADNVIVEIIDGQVTLKAKPNVAGLEKIIFRATDPQEAWCEGVMFLTLVDIPDKPIIYPIPDMNIHWHNPKSDDGYGYDFSYFIFDPDNDDSELTIWVSPLSDGTEISWMENDPNNNMRIIFKFPFLAAGKTHRLAIYVIDPQDLQNYRVFNITVIFDEWPIEQIRPISDQSFPEDEKKDNAFDLWDYFQDIDGGTNFEIKSDPNSNVKAEIDENNYVDLSSKRKDWNTGDGYVELVIIAKDSQPIQEVYAIVKIFVIPVNDAPILGSLPQKNITKGEKDTLDLTKYIDDVDTELSGLKVVTSTTDNIDVEVSGKLLIISSKKTGTYNVQVWVEDVDGTNSNIELLTIKIKPKDEGGGDNAYLLPIIIALIIIILIILIALFVVFTTYKVNEVFLIHKSGILLYHLSREHKPGRDEEVLSGMFTAVQDFIKDSFSTTGPHGSGGEQHILREMKIGENNNILIERGKYIYLAVIFSGRGAGKLRTRARGILETIETKYEHAFSSWVGDMDRIKGVENLLKPLLPTGATPVMTSDKQLGRVPAPASAAVPAPTPMAAAPAQIPVKVPVTPAPAQPAAVTPVTSARTVTPVQPAAAAAPVRTQVVATPTAPAQPTPAPTPTTPVTPAPAMPAQPEAPTGNCPKCGAIPNRFPDGSMLCPKCGYTGR